MSTEQDKASTALELLNNDLPQLQAIIGINAPSGSDLMAMARQEINYLEFIGLTKPEIFECEPLSIIAAVRTSLKQNLSLDPDMGLVYIQTRNVKVKDKSAPKGEKWIKVLETKPSGNGLISINRQCGRILDIKRPEVFYNATKKVIKVDVEVLYPSYPQPRWEKYEFLEHDFFRWETFSHKQNRKYKENVTEEQDQKLAFANPLYHSWQNGIDPEFARAKAVRHVLKKLGTNPNEKNAASPVLKPIEPIIDKELDKKAHEEETDYTQYEELKNDPPPPPPAATDTTTDEEESIIL